MESEDLNTRDESSSADAPSGGAKPSSEAVSGTVTFLLTDMEASTELLKKLGRDRYGRVLQEHGALLEAAFSEFRGQVIDTPGDAYFVAFKSASDAVFAAVQVQRSLNTHAWPNGVAPSVRIGIHTGEAAQRKERYLGLAVHRASRIGAAGHGGQVLISDATRALVEDELPAGVELRELGEHHLKDIDRPERLYQLRIPNLREQFPPLRTEASKTAFAGRERELAEVAQAAVRRRHLIGRRGVLTALLIAVGLACATAALLLTQGSSHSGRTEIAANALGMFRTDGDQGGTEIPLQAAPNGVAVGEGAVWVTNTGNETVSRVDPVLDRAVGTIQVGSGPTAVAVGGGAVWVVNSLDGTLSRINPAVNREVQRIRGVGSGPSAVAYGEHSVWVASTNDGLLFRINPKTGRVRKSIETGASAGDIAVGAGSVWVSNQASRTVVRVDAATNEVSGVISVGNGPTGVAFGAGSVWVANNLDGTLSRIDPATNGVTATIPVGGGPKGVTFAEGAVWVSDEFGGEVLRVDARTEKVEERLRVGNRPAGLDVSNQRLWIAVQPSGETHQGGRLTVVGAFGSAGTGGTSFDSIDPAVASLATSWSVLIMTNDGLTAFERVGGSEGARVVPDLAVSLPVPTAGGTTYTFRLRPGIRYSNGALVRPRDFRYALERDFKLHSPGTRYYEEISGGSRCAANPRYCDLSRGIVTNDAARTVTFHLVRSDPEFLHKLALPYAVAVPADTPLKEVRAPIPATGPYEIANYDPPKTVTLVRNRRFREWSKAAQPEGYPESIVWHTASSDAVSAVQQGRADVALPNPPPDRLHELRTQFPAQLRVAPRAETSYLFLNTRIKPFDDLRVRRALSFALDRRLLASFGGSYIFTPTCQVLPPNFPGYKPYCPYTLHPTPRGTWSAPDLSKAKQLIALSHTAGMKVTFWEHRVGPVALRYVIRLLTRLGFKTSIKSVPTLTAFSRAVSDSRKRAQIGFDGYAADYPAASNFITRFRCSSFDPGSPTNDNISQFCNKRIDREIGRALRLQNLDPQAANNLWARIDRQLVDEAPWVPVVSHRDVWFISRRVGNVELHPQYGLLIDQLWIR